LRELRLRLCPATFLGGVQELILWLHLLLLLVLSVVLLVTLLLLLLLLLYVRCAFMGGLLLLLLLLLPLKYSSLSCLLLLLLLSVRCTFMGGLLLLLLLLSVRCAFMGGLLLLLLLPLKYSSLSWLLLLLPVRCAFMGGLLLLLLLCCTPKGCHKWMPRELHQLLSCLVLLLPHMHPPKGPCLFQHIYARCGTASEVRCKRDVLLLLLCSHLP